MLRSPARIERAVDLREQVAGLVVVAIDDVGLAGLVAGEALVVGDERVAGRLVVHVLHLRVRHADAA